VVSEKADEKTAGSDKINEKKTQTSQELGEQKPSKEKADEFFKAATHGTDDAKPMPPGPAQDRREVIGRDTSDEK
jgi:hypothetical protein